MNVIRSAQGTTVRRRLSAVSAVAALGLALAAAPAGSWPAVAGAGLISTVAGAWAARAGPRGWP